MNLNHQLNKRLVPLFTLLLLSACGDNSSNQGNSSDVTLPGFEVKLLVGSALGEFCQQATAQFNQQQPKLDNGTAFHITCEAKGSGDVVSDLISRTQQFKAGTLSANSPEFPTLVSVDGEIYQSQLLYQMNQLFPGQKYIPEITSRDV